MRVARRFVIGGRVQGVGFRYFTEKAAVHNGLHGWARNLPDGRVEITAEGDADALDRFEQLVTHGPPGAQVVDVVVDNVTPNGRTTGFTIK